MKKTAEPARVKVESAVPGRVRLRVPRKYRKKIIINNWLASLESIEGVISATANLTSGGMLVMLNAELLEAEELMETLAGIGIAVESAEHFLNASPTHHGGSIKASSGTKNAQGKNQSTLLLSLALFGIYLLYKRKSG